MRLKCEFRTKSIPVANRMMIISLIKEAIKSVNEEYYNRLYNYEGKDNEKIKNFSFAVVLKDYTLKKDIFKIRDKVIIYITTPNHKFGINIYKGLLNIDHFRYKDFFLKKIKVTLMKENFIIEPEVVFKTISPICVKDKKGNFINIEDEGYEKELNYILDLSLKSYRGFGLKQKVKFIPVKMKKSVIKEAIGVSTEENNSESFCVNAYSGIFKLQGDVEDINFIYQAGLGFHRSEGFGLVDVI